VEDTDYFPEEYDIDHPDSAKNETQSYRTKLIRNHEITEEKEYLTDALSREAVTYVENSKNHPFFLYLAYNAPHAPLQASKKYLDRFTHIDNPKRKIYAAMVSAVDDGIGLILDKLDKHQLTNNTILVFLSDNGGPTEDNGSDNGPLRGRKGSLWEGGIRVPFAIRWPEKIKPGIIYEHPVISLDIFATIAANIKAARPPKNKLDGTDLLPYLTKSKKGAPHDYLFWRQYDQRNYAVISNSGEKAVIQHDSIVVLYDLKKDIGEKEDVAKTKRKKVTRLRNEIKKWEAMTIPPIFYGLNQEDLYQKAQKQNN
jgi:arylsulfatase A-like enzyme